MSALPWVLLGKRVQVQPDLDTSAAQLCYGKSLDLPGQLLAHPGAPLSNIQTKALLEELYKLSARPALQTSATVQPFDISYTEKATHVYVKVDNPQGLNSRFEGPYQIISRPSRSTIEVRIGSFADGRPRLQTYSWASCKIAHLRPDATLGQRPKLGRPSASSEVPNSTEVVDDATGGLNVNNALNRNSNVGRENEPEPASQTDVNNSLPAQPEIGRPVRSTRNPNPLYVDAICRPWSASQTEIHELNRLISCGR